MSMIIYLILVVLFCLRFECEAGARSVGKSPFDCTGREKWEVEYENNAADMKLFQGWIYSYQHTCGGKAISSLPPPVSGIGASIQTGVQRLVTAIGSNSIYRPDGSTGSAIHPGKWVWAPDSDKVYNCTFAVPAVDCYFVPLSDCGYQKHPTANWFRFVNNATDASIAENLAAFSTTAMDICTLAATMKKSVQWVHGQFMHYFTRYRPDIRDQVNERTHAFLGASSSKAWMDKSSSVAVHVRGDKAMLNSDGRSPAHLDHYMKAVDLKAEAMAAQNRPVGVVYLCSHVQQENIISAESMQHRYPRPWRYVVLEHTSLGAGANESVLADQTFRDKEKPYLRQQIVEYFSDIEMMVDADIFIGTFSSMYTLAAGLRVARYPHLPKNSTCFLDIRNNNNNAQQQQQQQIPALTCEGTVEAEEIWRVMNGGYKSNGQGGVYF